MAEKQRMVLRLHLACSLLNNKLGNWNISKKIWLVPVEKCFGEDRLPGALRAAPRAPSASDCCSLRCGETSLSGRKYC